MCDIIKIVRVSNRDIGQYFSGIKRYSVAAINWTYRPIVHCEIKMVKVSKMKLLIGVPSSWAMRFAFVRASMPLVITSNLLQNYLCFISHFASPITDLRAPTSNDPNLHAKNGLLPVPGKGHGLLAPPRKGVSFWGRRGLILIWDNVVIKPQEFCQLISSSVERRPWKP